MTKFSEYIKNDVPKQTGFSEFEQNKINEAIEKYSDYSSDQLLNEFVNQTNKQKQDGTFDVGKLENVKNTLTPYLSAEQQKRLNEILKMVE